MQSKNHQSNETIPLKHVTIVCSAAFSIQDNADPNQFLFNEDHRHVLVGKFNNSDATEGWQKETRLFLVSGSL